MTLHQYETLSAPFRTPGRRRAVILLNKAVTGTVYAAFALLCLHLLIRRDTYLWVMLVICGVPFVLLSLIRKRINAPRPYEVWGIEPLIPKDTKGKSFPSRHVFSAFVIAVTACPACLPLGIGIGVCGALLMAIRVIGGVHFPKDVVAGAFIGIVCGIIGIALWLLLSGGTL